MTRHEVYQTIHIVGVGFVAAATEILSYPDPITWRTLLKATVAGIGAAGLYWAKPPGTLTAAADQSSKVPSTTPEQEKV